MDDEVLQAADDNLAEAWKALVGISPAGAAAGDDDLLCLTTGSDEAFFNPVFPRREIADVEPAIRRIRELYAEWEVPFLGWVRDGTNARLLAAARDDGMAVEPGPPLMVMDPIVAAPPPPEGVVLRRVTSGTDVDQACTVAAQGFAMPEDRMGLFVNERVLGLDGVALFVAETDEGIVSTALLAVTGATAGIYTVATPERFRGRGYGAAVTWAAVAEGARRGCRLSILQASPQGHPVYERMGFVDAGRYDQFMPR